MIIKLVKAGGTTQLISCDEVMVQETAQYAMDVEIYRNGERQKRVLIGDDSNETAEWKVAYVMEDGKTVDTIRQYQYPPRESQVIRNKAGRIVAHRG